MMEQPTTCDACKNSLADTGHTTTYDAEGRKVRAVCMHCDELDRILKYRQDRVLTSRLTVLAGLYELYKDKVGSSTDQLGTDIRGWMRQLGALYVHPPKHVPEEAWPAFKRGINEAIEAARRGESLTNEAERLGLRSVGVVATLEHVMYHVVRTHQHGVFENGRPVDQPRTYDDVHASYKRVEVLVQGDYQTKVWFGGLQKFVRAASVKGHSAEAPGLKVMSYCMAGRAMQTLTLPNESSITLITAEEGDERRMGISGIEATEEDAILALQTAISAWEDGRIKLVDDREVSLL